MGIEDRIANLEWQVESLAKTVANLKFQLDAPLGDPAVVPAETPQPLREAPPSGLHGSMADVLGFPKEGR